MKRIKWTIMTLIISLSVGGALATAPQGDCRTQPQYYLTGGAYMPAGTFGVNYICDAGSTACTYVTNDFVTFFQCRTGTYRIPNPGLTDNNTKTKKSKK